MPKPRLAIIGAAGFVGSALCERLFFEGRRNFTAFIHTSGSAARIARLPIPMQELDLLDKQRTFRALAGYSTIVNCSRGDELLMIRGLKNLLATAKHSHIRKLIHIGSVAIYGNDPPSASATEACPPAPDGNEYGAMKDKQDRMVLSVRRAGIQAYVLCPSNITGPYSPFVHGLASRLNRGPLPLVDDGAHPCNLVHVDNLVEAILTAERQTGKDGDRYFVNDSPQVTWRQYFEDLARLLGITCRFIPVSRASVLPLLCPATENHGVIDHLKIAFSGEFRSALTLMPALRSLNTAASEAYSHLPARLQHTLRNKLERPVSIAKQRTGPALDEQFVRVQVRRVYHSPDKLIRELGYRPVVSYRQGLETMASWLRFTGVA